MTLQQLKYIVAIDRQRNFAKAAEQCGISQPTLSAMLVKLEEELDVRIFERSNKLVTPTTAGEKIIRQAEKALAEAERITELVAEDKGAINGELALSVGPTIAPYILPKFIRHYMESYPTVKLSIREMKADVMLSELLLGHLDAGIAISGNTRQGILEVPEPKAIASMRQAALRRLSASLMRTVVLPLSQRCTCLSFPIVSERTCAASRVTISHSVECRFISARTTSASVCSTLSRKRSSDSCPMG